MPATKIRKKTKKSPALPKLAAVVVPIPTPVSQEPETHPSDSSDSQSVLWRQRVAPAILLSLITFAIYSQVIHHPFSNYDDGEYVQDNADVHGGITWRTLRWALTSHEHANWHPVTWLSHALDWQLFGPNPSGHHLTSVLVHIANVVLLFLFLSLVTKSTARSLLVAALFAIHPINVESVAWVAERKNVLCTTFFLLSLLAYARYAQRPNLLRYLVVALLFAFSLASKPMVVTLPFVLLLLDYWPLQRVEGWTAPSPVFPAPQFPLWKLALEKFPLLALSLADGLITVVTQEGVHAIRSGSAYPLSLRIQNAICSYAAYIWKIIWPTHLAVLYPYPSNGLPVGLVILSALLLIAATVWMWRQRSRPFLMMGWLWFLGMLVPVIGLVQVGEQSMADRYAYLPLIGFLILAVWGAFDLAQNVPGNLRWTTAVAAAIVLIVFASLSVRQVGFWRSNIDLWSHTSAVTENNAVAEGVVGSELLLDALNHGRHGSKEAQVHFRNAARINPKDSEANMNIGADLQLAGHMQEALEKYKLALEYVQNDEMKAEIMTDMGSAYEQSGDFTTAREYYLNALKMKVGSKPNNTAFLGFARTFTDEKIKAQGASMAQHPTAEGYWELGQLQDAGGYTASAVASYQYALSLDPKLEKARTALAKDSPVAANSGTQQH